MKKQITNAARYLGLKLSAAVLLIMLTSIQGWGQTNPTAQAIPYSQNFDGLAHTSTTYPDGWQGWTISTSPGSSFNTAAPTADRSLIASSTAATNSGNVHNYNGKIGFLNSSSLDLTIVLAINTTGKSNIKVSYDIMTIRNPYDGSSNTRINEVTLQYRIGTSGTFTNLTGVEYQNNTTTQTTAITTPQKLESKSITLPDACNNQSVVQLRWASRQVSGSGSRPSFAVDNISVNTIPTLSTITISSIMKNTASSGGNITSDGGASVTARGVCWSTSSNPTLANSYTNDGSGTGSFTSSITGLSPNTLYYVRAYATNSVGTAYGNEISFTTQKESETVSGTVDFSSLTNVGSQTDVTVSGTLTVDDIGEINNLSITPTGRVTINPGNGLIINGNLLLESDGSGTASLIHNSNDITINGTTTIQRYLPAWTSNDDGWHLISSPVGGNALTNFTPSPASSYDFFAWDEATNTWLDQKLPANNISSFTLGKGYLVAYENAGTRNFSGDINTGDVALSLSYTASGPGIRGYNLIGNPFSSAINANINDWTKTNVNGYVYVWDDANGNYKSWDGTTGTLTSGIIPAMQGFWVKASGASPSITIPASSRTHSSQNFYKSSVNDVLTLNLKSNTNQKGDGLVVRFKSGATNQYDEQHDVPKLMSMVTNSPQFYSFAGTEKVSINALAPISSNVSVLLGFEPKHNGSFTINAENINSFALGTKILLEDTKTNTTQDLTTNPTYTFTANTSDNVNRFVLHFDMSAVTTGEINKASTGIFAFDNTIYVNTGEKIKQINVYNMLGQLVKSVNNINGLQKINMNGNPSGYYIVKVIFENSVISDKVLIK